MKKLIGLFLLLTCLTATAATNRITLTITVTNAANCTNGMVVTINAAARMATNTAYTATTFQSNETNTYLKTNLFLHLAANPIGSPKLILQDQGPTNFALVGEVDQAVTYALSSTNWASFVLSTQEVIKARGVRVPVSVEYDTNRQFIASMIVEALNLYATNTFGSNAAVLVEYVSRGTNAQHVLGVKTFESPILVSPAMTNGANYGNAFNCPGTGASSTQIGDTALASGLASVAVGNNAFATNTLSVAVGYQSRALGYGSIAIGPSATVYPEAYDGIAIGRSASALLSNSIAIGNSCATASENQILIGTSSHSTEFGGNVNVVNTNTVNQSFITNLTVVTNLIATNVILATVTAHSLTASNATLRGSNTLTGDLSFTQQSISSMANGQNRLDPSNYVFIRLSGPTAAWSIDGVLLGRSGRSLRLLNASGQIMTIKNESGWETTASQRIKCGGSDFAFPDASVVDLIYSATDNRWVLGPFSGTNTVSAYSVVISNSPGSYFTINANAGMVCWTNSSQHLYITNASVTTNSVVQWNFSKTDKTLDFTLTPEAGVLHWSADDVPGVNRNVVYHILKY